MDLSNPAAVLLIVTGLAAFLLLMRAFKAVSRDRAEPELNRARQDLDARTSSLREHRGQHAHITPSAVRKAIDSIAVCTRLLRRNATSAMLPSRMT